MSLFGNLAGAQTGQTSLFGGGQNTTTTTNPSGGGLFGAKSAMQKTTSSTNLLDLASNKSPSKSFFSGPISTGVAQQQTAGGIGGGSLFGNAQGNTGASTTGQASGGGLFGGASSTQQQPLGTQGGTGGGLFGAQTQANPSSGGAGGSSLFGGGQQQQQQPSAQGSIFGGGAANPSLNKSTSLFGGPSIGGAQTNAGGGSLFGGATTTQTQPSSGLFGGAQQQPSGGLFGQQTTGGLGGGLFGGSTGASQPTPGGLFGGGMTGQTQNQPTAYSTGTQQTPMYSQEQIAQQFFQVRQPQDATELLRRLLLINLPQPQKLELNPLNQQKARQFRDLAENDKNLAVQIQQRLNKQSELKNSISNQMNEIKDQVESLRENLQSGIISVQEHNQRALLTRLQVQKIHSEVQKIALYREELLLGISKFDHHDQRDGIRSSFKFFEQLYKDHQNVLSLLNQKLDEATGLVESLNFNKLDQLNREQQPLKSKIFEVLKLIYEQQKSLGQQLYKVDQCVRILRTEFANQIIANNPFLTYQDVDAMFKKYDTFEVDKAMKELQQKNQTNQLSGLFNNQLTLAKDKTTTRDGPTTQGRTTTGDAPVTSKITQLVHDDAVRYYEEQYQSRERTTQSQQDQVQGAQRAGGLIGMKRGASNQYFEDEIQQNQFRYFKPTLFRSQSQYDEISRDNSQQQQKYRFRPSQYRQSASNMNKRETKASFHQPDYQAQDTGSVRFEPTRRRTTALFQTQSTMADSRLSMSQRPSQYFRGGPYSIDPFRSRTIMSNPL
eukprot:403340368